MEMENVMQANRYDLITLHWNISAKCNDSIIAASKKNNSLGK